ncbi:MAG: HTH domain-containing protein [Candidatus Cloacimonetes bacterium]|nr:HTH domain-containing protein [Candidatus Cloacimonadota bacterium]
MVDLGIKGEKIEKSFKINNRGIIRIKGNKEIIIKLLEKNQFTVNQIADRINMTRQGVRYHIHNLIKENKVRLINNTSANWVYGV